MRRLNVNNMFFSFIELSLTVNLLKNVCLFIQIVNMMQNVLNQIVPLLIWVEEFQYCLQNQLQHQHHLPVVSSAVTSLLVRKWNVPSIIQNTVGLTLSARDLTVHFTIPPLLYHHDMPWNGFDLRLVNDIQSYLAEDCGAWKFPSTDERYSTEFVKSLKLGIYCFHNMKFIAYLKCLIFQVCKFIKWFY